MGAGDVRRMEAVSLSQLNQRFGVIALQAEAALVRVKEREKIARLAKKRIALATGA